jgi:hypothetical protein
MTGDEHQGDACKQGNASDVARVIDAHSSPPL